MKRIDIEVEVGNGLVFEIVEEIDGFWVSYDPEAFGGWKPSRDDLKWVVEDIKTVMKDLNVQAPHFALELVLFGGLGPSNPTCCVDKRKEVIYLLLPIDVVHGQLAIDAEIYEDLRIFYHELMHAKDVLEGRFPSCGFINPVKNPELAFIASLSHFSIEGRLKKSGKPHKRRRRVIEDEYSWLSTLNIAKFITKESFKKFCDELWGKEVTFQELLSYWEKVKLI